METTNCGQSQQGPMLAQSVELDLQKITGSVHFIGIGGIGMSAIAKLLMAQGVAVSGSDREGGPAIQQLVAAGARIVLGHSAENLDGASAVVISTAIARDNPELLAARNRSLPIWHRSALLAYLSQSSKLIAVSGTHGKTTTTAMVAQVLLDLGLSPSVVVGGIFRRIGSNAYLGSGEYFVAEADESDGTHAHTASYMALVTNIESDHLEHYPRGIEQIRDNMVVFANNTKWGTIICQDDLGCRLIRPRIQGRVISYGNVLTSPDADYTYESLPGFSFKVSKAGITVGEVTLAVPGEHNKLNALAACVVAMELGLSFPQIANSLKAFQSVNRRFEIIGQRANILVVDDYAHHPTEVAATLKATHQYLANSPAQASNSSSKRRVVAVFQPHQPGRLRDLWDEFCGAFRLADVVLVTDIYIARGLAIEGITSERFASAIQHPCVHFIPGKSVELAKGILPYLQSGDIVLTIGAGDITKVGSEILSLLTQQASHGKDT
ncbi:MAG: UDP-N-acetylmuramate--L-alanine ligase [Candidatus Melainabacteria bacterium]|nr:UDP-N-acetylmuramate--L-alanine ligase [Candidatus Melainabacteria bacterium]